MKDQVKRVLFSKGMDKCLKAGYGFVYGVIGIEVIVLITTIVKVIAAK